MIRNQGVWNGTDVIIKMIDKEQFYITTAVRIEVKNMRELRHLNLVNFLGACCEPPNMCILMEMVPKAS